MIAASLEKEQENLFIELVEASRRVPREQRGAFLLLGPTTGDVRQRVLHRGFACGWGRMLLEDVEVLASRGIVQFTVVGSHNAFFIPPEGYAFYDEVMRARGDAVAVFEDPVVRYLNGDAFRTRHPRASEKWLQAQELLWSADSEEQLTTIGFRCREAMLEFADELVARTPITPLQPKSLYLARVRAVIATKKATLGEARAKLLDALIVYWNAVHLIVDRQTHGATKEGQVLMWEDARRVVFQTAIVFHEITSALM